MASLATHRQAGIDWFLALDDAFASLAEFPEQCPIEPENARFNFEVRQLLTKYRHYPTQYIDHVTSPAARSATIKIAPR